MKDANDINQLNKDSFYSKALADKLDYENYHPTLHSALHDIIQHTLRQTTQISKSTIQYASHETSSEKSVSNAKTQKVK
jgi:hypothetical protein